MKASWSKEQRALQEALFSWWTVLLRQVRRQGKPRPDADMHAAYDFALIDTLYETN